MIRRIVRVALIELDKLRRRPGSWALLVLVLLVAIGQAAATAAEVEAQRDRTRELNAWLVFADAADTGLFVVSLLLVMHASLALAGESALGTLKGLLVRPVTRTELVLGKLAALLVSASVLAASVLGAAAGAGAVLSDYGGVKTVAHSERETGLLAGSAGADAGTGATDRPDLRRLGFAARWDAEFSALRVERVLPGSLAEARQIQPGDLVTHAGTGTAPPARLRSGADWTRWAASLGDGDDVRLKLDSPVVTPNRDFTADYVGGQARRAIGMVPLALLAALGFGLLGSSLTENAGLAVGGTLLSYLALRYVAGALIVSVARMAGAAGVFVADVDRFLFTHWLAFPMARLRGAATATSNLEIKESHLAWSAAVCAATAALALAWVLWRIRRKDVL
jgi:ABC-type transport system involved in multi-copper enzyme maturation permease subunit